jgi:hypothetical protein
MNGMEMMLSRLIGLKPEELKAKVEQATSLMEHGAKAMADMQSDINAIKRHLGIEENSQEETLNGGRAITSNRNSANNRIEL